MDGEGEVTPIGSVKRKKSTIHEPDYTSCLICQEGGSRGEKLSQATDDGKMKVQNAAAERTRLKDCTSLSILNRLKNMSEEDWSSELKWHKMCYINFASESRLSRLRDRRSKEQVVQAPTSVVDQPSTSSSFHGTRKQGHAVNWEHCIFCQQPEMKDIHSVMTMKMSQKVLDLSKEDSVMSVRMANVVDLIAAEGKYHTKCYVEFERRVRRKKVRHLKCSDQALNDLGDMLLEGLSVGNVYDTGEAWETIC